MQKFEDIPAAIHNKPIIDCEIARLDSLHGREGSPFELKDVCPITCGSFWEDHERLPFFAFIFNGNLTLLN